MSTYRRSRPLALAAILALLGGLLVLGTLTPAASHVTRNFTHLWTKHIKPKADQRYYTKVKANRRFNDSRSGVWSVSAEAGELDTVNITFNPPIPDEVVGQFLFGTSPQCPGIGQAEPGYLCLYTSWNNGMSPYPDAESAFHDPTSAGTGIATVGTVVYFDASGPVSNARGTWAVQAPPSEARPAPRLRVTPGPTTG